MKRLLRKQGKWGKSKLVNPPSLRTRVTNNKVQDDLVIQTYWKDLALGRGPAIIVYAYEREAVKFDCFGAPKGHYHLRNTRYMETIENRIFLPENSIEEQVERAIFEIQTNLRYYLQRSRHRKTRRLAINQPQLEKTLLKVERQVLIVCTDAHRKQSPQAHPKAGLEQQNY